MIYKQLPPAGTQVAVATLGGPDVEVTGVLVDSTVVIGGPFRAADDSVVDSVVVDRSFADGTRRYVIPVAAIAALSYLVEVTA